VSDALDRWHRFVQEGDLESLDSILSDEVAFLAPTYWKPRSGKIAVMLILVAVAQLFEDFSYRRQWIEERDWALEFSARLDEFELKGIDLIHLNDEGLIESFEVMIRPPNAVAALREAMASKLAELQGQAPPD
jgi:hypothetical protein